MDTQKGAPIAVRFEERRRCTYGLERANLSVQVDQRRSMIDGG